MDIVLILIFLFFLYFAPALIASFRGHINANAIAVLNLLLGWTFFGWAISLVWAVTHFEEVKE